MVITIVCSHCRNHDKDPQIEINFKDGKIYYICPDCEKESVISLKADSTPLPRIRRM
jgi:hypothetical protein